jgi:hypothetical protein
VTAALPRPHCRRCDTALANDLQRKHGLCDLHIAEYQAMRAVFYTTGAEPTLAAPAEVGGQVDYGPPLTVADVEEQGLCDLCLLPLGEPGTDPDCLDEDVKVSGAKTAGSGFDAKHARDFLDALFGPINTGRIGVTAIGDGYIRNAHFQRAHEAARQAETWDQLKPVGIYFRVTTLPPEGVKGRGGAEDSHALNCMWADLDYGTIGHKPPSNGPRLPADADEALTLIEGLPEVSILINSGGGLYPLWVFNEPVYLTDDNRPKLAKMAEGWQHRINKRAGQRNLHYGVGVGNLDRLLRLPGTINRKAGSERPCRVVHTSGKVHALWG